MLHWSNASLLTVDQAQSLKNDALPLGLHADSVVRKLILDEHLKDPQLQTKVEHIHPQQQQRAFTWAGSAVWSQASPR